MPLPKTRRIFHDSITITSDAQEMSQPKSRRIFHDNITIASGA
jgi:lipopolysaccharide export system protein LptA